MRGMTGPAERSQLSKWGTERREDRPGGSEDTDRSEALMRCQGGANGTRTRNPLLAKTRSRAHRALLPDDENCYGRSQPH
jgi:hypothetical protein